LTTIRKSITGYSGLKSITIPNAVTLIGREIFSGCISLRSIDIPNSVYRIFHSAFYDCISLTSITLPNSVLEIEGKAFHGCSSLTEIYSKNPTPPSVYSFTDAMKTTCKLYVPNGSKQAYQTKWGWKADNIIEMDFTTINPVNKDNTTIKSVVNGICIETKVQTPVSVYNLSGQTVYQSVINGSAEISLDKGVYVVRVGNESEKVIIK